MCLKKIGKKKDFKHVLYVNFWKKMKSANADQSSSNRKWPLQILLLEIDKKKSNTFILLLTTNYIQLIILLLTTHVWQRCHYGETLSLLKIVVMAYMHLVRFHMPPVHDNPEVLCGIFSLCFLLKIQAIQKQTSAVTICELL